MSIQYNQVGYGLTQPLITLAPYPISALRNPNGSDHAQIGQLWINRSSNNVYVLTSIVNNVANWQTFSGGAGIFSSLTVNPGPTSLSTVGNGAVSIGNATNSGAITITVGTGNFALVGAGHTVGLANDAAANLVTLGSLTGGASLTLQSGTAGTLLSTGVTGTITLGQATMTGTITIGRSTAGAGQTINIGVTAAPNLVNVGSTNGAAHTTIQGGTLGITLTAPFVALPGPVFIYTGAGAPSAGLALHVGDMYINTTAASATTRASCYGNCCWSMDKLHDGLA